MIFLSVSAGEVWFLKDLIVFHVFLIILLNKRIFSAISFSNVDLTIKRAYRVNPALLIFNYCFVLGSGTNDWDRSVEESCPKAIIFK